ncbi:short-chain dehydrogenase [Pseudonocardia sp. CNS-139]|nr:short-chain dehydrogenase [Pseudonocardia sp. CNS-139]
MTGRVIAVLGAGPGLGMSMARRFGREGFTVALVSRNAERHGAYRDELAAAGVQARSYAADLTDGAQAREVLGRVTADLGAIDTVYVGLAALDGSLPAPITEADGPSVRDAFETAVVPPVALAAAVLPGMRERGAGTLFFAGGLSGLRPMPMLGSLAPASAALRMYVLTLNAALDGTGVYAATLTIGGLIERGDIHRMFEDQGIPMTATLNPDDIAERAWHMRETRTEAEAVFDVLGTQTA